MCGIAGRLNPDPERPVSYGVVHRMTQALHHRGPDDEGVWVGRGIGLGSRRLAVIDLSERGHMPMASKDGRLVIAFNGEIYNYQDLRKDLEPDGAVFQSETDTETVLHLYERYGERSLDYLRGMFAFAIWDNAAKRLFIARDRLGKKPLYYCWLNGCLTFASEAKALLAAGDIPNEPDLEALHHYLTWGYVPSPWSAFRAIRKLPPAHYLNADARGIHVARYWTVGYEPKRTETEDRLAEELRALLLESVRLRMISDVPLGALLSGGMDSATVVALMRELGSGTIKTFSIGSRDPQYDELPYARAVARKFDTSHIELIVEPDPRQMLETVATHYSEPFADSSAVPSLEVSRLARTDVTVALSGDGGDESFLGYDRYRGTAVAGRVDVIPVSIRRRLAALAGRLPATRTKGTLARLRRFGRTLALSPERRYAEWVTALTNDAKAHLYSRDFAREVAQDDSVAILERAYAASDARTFVERTAHADLQTYLPDDLLVKMDIASMAHSLEVRSPLLDHKVVEFAARLPANLKLRGRQQKYLLKKAMSDVLPDAVLSRRKMGFGVPVDSWLRHELRDAVIDIVLGQRLRERGYFEHRALERLVYDHLAARANNQFPIWSLLMLELWHRRYVDAPAIAISKGA